MNSLNKLAIVIYDNFQQFDRTVFLKNLIINTESFDVTFFYIGLDKNSELYDLVFDKKLINNNSTNEFVNLLVEITNKFDFYLFITPIINILSQINEKTLDFDKINCLFNKNFLIFSDKNKISRFIQHFSNLNSHNELNFNYLKPGIDVINVTRLSVEGINKFQIIYDTQKSISKIALVLTGISHDNGNHLSGWNQHYYRSFLSCYQNHFEMIIKPFEQMHIVKTFLATYKSDTNQKLLQIYNPNSYIILDSGNMRSTYIKSIENLINSAPDIDFFICTRFDIKFYNKLTNWNFDYKKFNFIFIENWGDSEAIEVTDVLFAFPGKFLNAFYSALLKADKKPRRKECIDLHYIYEFVKDEIGKENIHFIESTKQSTANATFELQNQNTYFFLCRELAERNNN